MHDRQGSRIAGKTPGKALLGAALAALVSLPAPASAEGFRIYSLSAEAQTRGEAVVASVSDASAIWYNPGALTQSGKLDMSLHSNQMWIKAKYTDLLGRTEANQKSHFTPFGFYTASNVGTERFAVGLGINTPFGLGTEYSKTAPFRYITTGGQIEVINVNPTVAMKLHSAVSMGVGLDYYYSTAKLTQQYPWAAVAFAQGLGLQPFPDGDVSIEGKGDGFGFNTGLLIRPAEHHSIGLTYRSQVVVKYSGRNAEINNIPAVFQGVFARPGSKYTTEARTSIRFPDMVGLGYAYRPSDKWVWEISGNWTNWNDVGRLNVDLKEPNALFPNTSSAFDWKNAFAIRTGGEYNFTDNFGVGAGYFYNQSPTIEQTYSPLVPEGDHHVFSVGLKYRHDDWTFRLPVAGLIQTGRGSVNSNVTDATGTQNADGKYDLYFIQVGIGISYAFGG